MRGLLYGSDDQMSDSDLYDLADALAVQVHNLLGPRVFRLQRSDVAELIAPYICDLAPQDQQALPWMIWDLFQEAREMGLEHER